MHVCPRMVQCAGGSSAQRHARGRFRDIDLGACGDQPAAQHKSTAQRSAAQRSTAPHELTCESEYSWMAPPPLTEK